MPDDVRRPARQAGQITDDEVRTGEQVRKLGSGVGASPDLGEVLRMRHAQRAGALKLDIVDKQQGGQAFVVARQLVIPQSDGRVDADAELTGNRGFVRRGFLADDPRSASLRDRVWVYTFESGTDDDARKAVVDALEYLESTGVEAAPTMVTALHMVFKSTDGPARTSVEVAGFPADGAPQGEIVIAVIDTGIDEHLRKDGWLNEVGRRSNDNIDQLDVFALTGTPAQPVLDLGAGHGTFVAGIIRQVDPLARVVVYRALDTDGLASEESVAAAMMRAANDGAHVINLSLGMEKVGGIVPPTLAATVEQIRGLPTPPAIVASAGNNGTDEEVYPAAFKDVISVAALQAVPDSGSSQPPWPVTDGATWSSYGTWVRCSAVGEGIVSTFVKGREDPHFGNDVFPRDSWAVWSGTSFAAPQIAAHIAKTYREGLESPQPPDSPQAVADTLFPEGGGDSPAYGTRMVLLPGTKPSP